MAVTMTRGSSPRGANAAARLLVRRRALITLAAALGCYAVLGGQLVRLALRSTPEVRSSMAEALGGSWSRPDIVDRNGRLLASDVAVNSLYADPHLILDLDEVIEKLVPALPGLDAAELRKELSDRSRRFVWIARALAPRVAQRVLDLGLPGLAFRLELRRAYPLGSLAGHVLGAVNTDNRGVAGVELTLDRSGLTQSAQGVARTTQPPVRLSLDIGVQHAVADELMGAMQLYKAPAAAALVLDVASGEVLASVSLPAADPSRPSDWLEPDKADRLSGGTYELGSVFKMVTVAMALEDGIATLDKIYDVRQPLMLGGYTINDLHAAGRPLSVREVFLHSSNVGAGMMALEAGADRQRAFLARLGLLDTMHTETGLIAPPQTPKTWGKTETATIGFGHGFSVAPLQFAAAAAALVNGGRRVTPTLFARKSGGDAPEQLVSPATSAALREIMRLNVTNASGTGKRAEADGYRVGGKTGTAEIPGRGGYQEKSVISSFVAAFPMDAPRYLTYVLLFEPRPTEASREHITAGTNAAPATGRIVARIAPLLGVLPRLVAARARDSGAFDAPTAAQ
ncbi:MAG TPA: penicillin-binding protein 2 [Hyphomicrobiaceae bacterium]|nr:penicillin-binding protein 2 [Hyphomicrobiaceae bacterium]